MRRFDRELLLSILRSHHLHASHAPACHRNWVTYLIKLSKWLHSRQNSGSCRRRDSNNTSNHQNKPADGVCRISIKLSIKMSLAVPLSDYSKTTFTKKTNQTSERIKCCRYLPSNRRWTFLWNQATTSLWRVGHHILVYYIHLTKPCHRLSVSCSH